MIVFYGRTEKQGLNELGEAYYVLETKLVSLLMGQSFSEQGINLIQFQQRLDRYV